MIRNFCKISSIPKLWLNLSQSKIVYSPADNCNHSIFRIKFIMCVCVRLCNNSIAHFNILCQCQSFQTQLKKKKKKMFLSLFSNSLNAFYVSNSDWEKCCTFTQRNGWKRGIQSIVLCLFNYFQRDRNNRNIWNMHTLTHGPYIQVQNDNNLSIPCKIKIPT